MNNTDFQLLAQAGDRVERHESQSSGSVISIDFSGLFGQFMNIEGLLMLGVFAFLAILSKLSPRRGKLTSGRFCTSSDKIAAGLNALKQIESCKHKAQPVTLWSGTPQYWFNGKRSRGFSVWLQTMLSSPPTIWFPNSERGTLVIGAPGSGKTFSVIDRMVESAFQQGFSTIIYDKKGDQMKDFAPLAARYGYNIEVFAPGESFSGVINPLDFMRDAQDSVMAGEIGRVIAQNGKTGDSSAGNDFFDKAGEMMAKGLVQLAKSSPYPDLAMVYAFIQLPNFIGRLYHAAYRDDEQQMNRWVAASFSQLLSSKDAEKTVAGIKASAEAIYSAFIQKDLLRAFIGHSTIPLRLEGKQCIIFKLDDERREVVGPLLAAAFHLCVVKNLAQKRSNPFVYVMDEFPSLKFDRIVQWVNEYRSNGGVPIIGIQSLSQLYDRYGDKQGAAIASALSTHVLFNPGDYDTAEKYSKRYGEMEVTLKNRSTGRSMGGQQNNSRSLTWNEQLHKKPLISPDRIMRFPQGKCVITSPAYSSGGEALFPYLLKIPVKSADIKRIKESSALWDKSIRPQLQERVVNSGGDKIDLDRELSNRIEMAFKMLPDPENTDEDVVVSGSGVEESRSSQSKNSEFLGSPIVSKIVENIQEQI